MLAQFYVLHYMCVLLAAASERQYNTKITTLISYGAYFGAPILHHKPLRAATMISIGITLPTFREQQAESETLLQCKASIFVAMGKNSYVFLMHYMSAHVNFLGETKHCISSR